MRKNFRLICSTEKNDVSFPALGPVQEIKLNTLTVFILIFAVLTAVLCIRSQRDAAADSAQRRESFRKEYGTVPAQQKNGNRYSFLKNRIFNEQSDGFSLDSITWNDLDMDRIFRRLDYCRSAPGEELLLKTLKNPDLSGRTERFSDSSQQLLSEKENMRLDLSEALRRLYRKDEHCFSDDLSLLSGEPGQSSLPHFAGIAAFFLGLAVIAFVSTGIGTMILLCVIIFNVVTYYRYKSTNSVLRITFRYMSHMLTCADQILAVNGIEETFPSQILTLREFEKTFQRFRKTSWIAFGSGYDSSGPLDLFLDYLRILFHIDLIECNSMRKSALANSELIRKAYTAIGEMDAELSVSYFRASLPHVCTPEFINLTETESDSGKTGFKAINLIHILVEDPVPNSIDLNGCALFTGSNASGKSTFLKSAALCAVLSQTVNTAPADEYRAAPMKIMTSMALRDDLASGESYFTAEIRSLHRILDAASDHSIPVLAVIDEVLRGTNTLERIAASASVLKELSESGVLCLAATHDGELNEILENFYGRYHFEETVDKDNVIFNYRLYPGPAVSRNAILLLRSTGYPVSVTNSAETLADFFLSEGTWRKL